MSPSLWLQGRRGVIGLGQVTLAGGLETDHQGHSVPGWSLQGVAAPCRTKRRRRALRTWHWGAAPGWQAEGCPRRPAGTASPLGTWRAALSAIDPPGGFSEVHGTACSRSGHGSHGLGNRSSFPFGNARGRRFQEQANLSPKPRQSWGTVSLPDRGHRWWQRLGLTLGSPGHTASEVSV